MPRGGNTIIFYFAFIWFSKYYFQLGKRGHKGGRRHFTDPQAIEAAKAKEEKEKEWRRARGEVIESESEGSDDEKDDNKASSGDDDGIGFKQESSESESESEDEERKPKGAEGLIGQRQNICFYFNQDFHIGIYLNFRNWKSKSGKAKTEKSYCYKHRWWQTPII